jgi:hypothetical protein
MLSGDTDREASAPRVVTPAPEIVLDSYSLRARFKARRVHRATCFEGSVATPSPDSDSGPKPAD